jgi:hypothetical protein
VTDKAQRYWYDYPIRIVQTVLRLPDAIDYDAKAAIDYVRRLHGNTCIVNAGGIYAFYPTENPLQRRASTLEQDIVGEIVQEAHKQGVRVLARIDFRGSHREVYEQHPDWFSCDAEGQPIMMNGLYMTNPASPYRNEGYGFDVLREILGRYDVDGIWENAPSFGPISYDPYSRKAFREKTGFEIPKEADLRNPIYRAHLEWRYEAILEHTRAFREVVKSFGEDKGYISEIPSLLNVGASQDLIDLAPQLDIIAGMTFDLIRGSYGSPFYPVPVWHAEESTKYMKAARPEKMPLVLFGLFDNQSRYTAVVGAELRLWLASALAHGGAYYMCTFVGTHGKDFLDQRNQEVVATFYELLERNEEVYLDAAPVADVAVVHSQASQDFFGDRDPRLDGYVQHVRGAELALFENHIPFDILPQSKLTRVDLSRYRAIILPNVAIMSDEDCEVLRAYVQAGGGLVATYETSLYRKTNEARDDFGLADVLGVRSLGVRFGPLHHAYTLLRERNALTIGLEETQICTNEGMIWATKAQENTTVPATLVPECVPQPPERGWRESMETPIPVVVAHKYGKGRSVFFPGQTDKLFISAGHPDYGVLLRNAVNWATGEGASLIQTDALPSVHVSVTRQPHTDRILVHLLNYTGGYRRPITHIVSCTNISITLRADRTPQRAYLLREKQEIPLEVDGNRVTFVVPTVCDYEAVVLE